MNKTLSYTTFAVATLLMLLLFVTSRSYIQLALAILLYPAVAMFALKVFPRKIPEPALHSTAYIPATLTHTPRGEKMNKQVVEVTDIDKRTFLKLIGATGLSFFVFSILGRRAESLLFGTQNIQSVFDNSNQGVIANGQSSASETSATAVYKISEIDNGVITYYGFIKPGGWFIMREDTENGSFRYVKGGGDFPKNWANRQKLQYDYYDNVF